MNVIVIGSDRLGPAKIVSGSLTSSHALAGETLAADTLTLVLDVGRDIVRGFVPKGETVPLRDKNGIEVFCYIQKKLDVSKYKAGDSLLYYANDILVGKYFLQSVRQISKTRYQLNAISSMGVLAGLKHYGGMYTETLASVILEDILQGFDYSIDEDVGKATVSGYLPIATKRDNLQQVLFATGGAVFTSPSGGILIDTMSGVSSGDFGMARCYAGGAVETGEIVDGVELTEHNYFASPEVQTLYEDGVDGEITLEFGEPYHDLVCSGGTITESGANYCKVRASGTVTLTGKKYTHITRAVTAGAVSNGINTIKSITDAYLANPQIAQTLAKRVFDMLGHNVCIKQDVLLGTERAGDVVTVVDPYTDEVKSATVSELDVAMSEVNKAAGTFLVGYIPGGVVSGYRHYVVLKGSGSWTVPNDVGENIRVIMVGAGGGGNGGSAGKNSVAGKDGSQDYRSVAEAGKGSEGGAGGTGGEGGKIYELTKPVTKGQIFSYSCGMGGAGGTGGKSSSIEANQTEPTEGGQGTETVFDTHSSASGKQYPYGYYEPKTGLLLASLGTDGKKGAKGGDGGAYPNTSSEIVFGADGEALGTYVGGKGASGEYSDFHESAVNDTLSCRVGGGGGGGAAEGANGDNGSLGTIDSSGSVVLGGKGGNGAKGGKGADGASYGSGGSGGNGGGGGGGGGAAFRRSFGEYSTGVAYAGRQGIGGSGGNAGKGGDGAVIIYY